MLGMAEERSISGWLPPRAPGGEPPPRWEPAPPELEPGPEPEPPATAAASWTPPPAARSPVFAGRPARTGNGIAATGLVLGIIGVTLLVLTLGLGFIVTIPCSAAAWICAAQARARIAAGETAEGAGNAQAAYVLGIVGVVLGVLAAIGWGIALAASGGLEELQRDLERASNPDAVQAMLGAAAGLRGR
jgi:hypothetical protein